MCWPKGKAKENGHCQKTCEGFWQLFGKRRLFGRPSFKTNPQELSTLCIYPENSWKPQRTCQSKKILSISTVAQYFVLQLRRNIPLTNMTSIMFCFSKHAMERKCINSHTGLGEGWYWRASPWTTSETYTCFKKQSTLELWQVLTGAVLSKLPHPNGFGLGFSSTLQGARLESYTVLVNNSENRTKAWMWVYKGRSTNRIGIVNLNEHLKVRSIVGVEVLKCWTSTGFDSELIDQSLAKLQFPQTCQSNHPGFSNCTFTKVHLDDLEVGWCAITSGCSEFAHRSTHAPQGHTQHSTPPDLPAQLVHLSEC